MTATATPALPVVSRGAIWGTLLGCTAWLLPLAVLCAARGRADALLDVVLPMLLASLGLGGVLVAVLVLARHAASPATFAPLFVGALGVALGTMLLLAEAFVSPLLLEDAHLQASVRAMGGVSMLPRALPLAALSAGVVGLCVGLRRWLRG